MEKINETCPKCESRNVAMIQYGLPKMSNELRENLNNNDTIVFGGCMIGPDSPIQQCNECGFRWGRLYDQHPSLFGDAKK